MLMSASDSLLCLANFPSNTGYAWDFIEGLYAGAADRLAEQGVETWVAYPSIESEPRPLEGSAARAVEMQTDLGALGSLIGLVLFVRKNRVRALYLADRPTWHPAYAALRVLGGVRWIVVHDHTSGERTRPTGLKRVLKRWSRSWPGFRADHVIGVSEYVARRQVEVHMLPPTRVSRIWNAIEMPEDPGAGAEEFFGRFGLDRHRPVVMCFGRAARQKGLQYMFEGFDLMLTAWPAELPEPELIYFGDGPYLRDLQSLRARLTHGDHIHMPGYVADASRYSGAATLCVFPSTWAEAFGLGALEPMARGVPVVATNVGGLPEVVVDGETGLLVPPGDSQALAHAMRRVLTDADLRASMGRRARDRVRDHFQIHQALDEITAIVSRGFRSTP